MSGTLVAVSGKHEDLLVSQLQTKMGVYKSAIVRAQDIVFVEVCPDMTVQ